MKCGSGTMRWTDCYLTAPMLRRWAISSTDIPATSRRTRSVSAPNSGAGPVARPKDARHGQARQHAGAVGVPEAAGAEMLAGDEVG